MSSATHSMKKRLSVMATKTKTLESNMPVTYTAAKARTVRERKALEEALELIGSAGSSWTTVSSEHKRFAELVEGEAPAESALHKSSAPIVTSTRSAHAKAAELPREPIPTLVSHVNALVMEMKSVEKDFSDVETAFNETQRYERKVEKLANKAGKAAKIRGNNEKLAGARATYESKLESVVSRMDRSHGKFEAGLQCAQTAFWTRHDSLIRAVDEASIDARKEAAEVKDGAVAMDVTASTTDLVTPEATEVEKTDDSKVEKAEKTVEENAKEVADKAEEKAKKAADKAEEKKEEIKAAATANTETTPAATTTTTTTTTTA